MNEVKLDDCGHPNGNVEFSAAAGGIVAEEPDDNDDKEWVSLNELGENLGLPHGGEQPQTISEQIAQVSMDPSLYYTVPHGNSRDSSRRTSQKRQRRSHRLQSADCALRSSGYTWPWSLDSNSLSTIWSRLHFGRIKTGALCSALCVPPQVERLRF